MSAMDLLKMFSQGPPSTRRSSNEASSPLQPPHPFRTHTALPLSLGDVILLSEKLSSHRGYVPNEKGIRARERKGSSEPHRV